MALRVRGMEKNQRFKHRFVFAFAGIRAGLRENSFRTQLFFAIFAMLALIVIRPEVVWWGLIIFTCAVILAAELFNTSLEAICDHVSPEFHPAIKLAKDTAAGAVLVLSMAAVFLAVAMVFDTFF